MEVDYVKWMFVRLSSIPNLLKETNINVATVMFCHQVG